MRCNCSSSKKDIKNKGQETSQDAIDQSLRDNPGAAINKADHNNVSNSLVKEEVKSLNNNPRNTDL